MPRKILAPILLTLATASASAAGEAEICYTTWAATLPAPATNETVFNCPIAGNKTFPQLGAAGWAVIQLVTVGNGGNQYAHQIVIQKR